METMHDDLAKRQLNHLLALKLRRGNRFYGMLELQLELRADNFNVYIKLPRDGLYETANTWVKVDRNKTKNVGLSKISQPNPTLPTVLNPYLSWHGKSGELHVNGFENDAQRTHNKTKLLTRSQSETIQSADKDTYKLATVILPLNVASYPEHSAPPFDFEGSYTEVSDAPYLPERLLPHENCTLVIDHAKLKPDFLLVDILLHTKDDLQIPQDLASPAGAEIIFVTDQLQYAHPEETKWKISIFPYQNSGKIELENSAVPIRFIGYSKDATEDIVFGATLVA